MDSPRNSAVSHATPQEIARARLWLGSDGAELTDADVAQLCREADGFVQVVKALAIRQPGPRRLA